MRLEEIRALVDGDLALRREELKEAAMRMRFNLKTNQEPNHAAMRVLKRDIARINTILREREIDRELQQTLAS